MLYFAYGSNLHLDQLAGRCPSATFVSAARLSGYRLAFTRFSPRRKCGVLDIVADPQSIVWGGLFDVHANDLPQLDRAEFCHSSGYRRRQVCVERHDVQRLVAAVTYEVVDKLVEHQTPSADYLQTVLAGARACRLPDGYLETIRNVAADTAPGDSPAQPK